jgi:hypothetical protein
MARPPKTSNASDVVQIASRLAQLKQQSGGLFQEIEQLTSRLFDLVGVDNPVVLPSGESVVLTDQWVGKTKAWKQVPFDRFVVQIQPPQA